MDQAGEMGVAEGIGVDAGTKMQMERSLMIYLGAASKVKVG